MPKANTHETPRNGTGKVLPDLTQSAATPVATDAAREGRILRNKGLDTSTLRYGDYAATRADMPESSIFILAQRAFNHICGNEVDSYVGGLAAKKKADGTAMYTADELDAFADAKTREKIADIMAGAMNPVTGGTRMTGLDVVIRNKAEQVLKAFFESDASKGIEKPKGDDWKNTVAEYMKANYQALKSEAEAEQEKHRAQAKGAASAIASLFNKGKAAA